MDTDHPKTKDLQVDLAKNNKKRFDTLNYEFDRPLPISKQTSYCIKKRGIGQNSNEKVFVLGPKMYSYLTAMLIKGQSL